MNTGRISAPPVAQSVQDIQRSASEAILVLSLSKEDKYPSPKILAGPKGPNKAEKSGLGHPSGAASLGVQYICIWFR